MLYLKSRKIVEKGPEDDFPEIMRDEKGSIVYVKYVKMATGSYMVMQYDIDPDDAELVEKVADFMRSEEELAQEIPRFEQESKKENPQSEQGKSAAGSGKKHSSSGHKRKRKKRKTNIYPAVVILLLSLIGLIILFPIVTTREDPADEIAADEDSTGSGEGGSVEMSSGEKVTGTGTEIPESEIEFHPHCVESTRPERWITSTEVCVDGKVLSHVFDYAPSGEISFGSGSRYTALEGVITFRGNNFRDDPTYGCANMTDYDIESAWTVSTGYTSYDGTTWTGSGWTGQPLIVKWPNAVKRHMNMYDSAIAKKDLVEVIYACMDGYIYFLDLKTGQRTRDPMYIGYTFKGSGALDPRGYPILYVGAGYDSDQGVARVFIINLLDCTVMHTFGNIDPFSLRGRLSYFDSSPLVDAETDTLIYPGENGIIYLMKLGTQYDEENGTLSIDPKHVTKWHYTTKRFDISSYWYGMEDSAVIYRGYLFILDNGGNFFCLDLNTLELVWVQDSLDDSNSTPVLSIEDGKVYLYASTSFHLGWRSLSTAAVPIWKVDAETGEIIWQTEYTCYSSSGVSGGVQSTIAVGRDSLDDYIYVTVAKTGGPEKGVLACIRKSDGEVVWEHAAIYAWSSPLCVYNRDGRAVVLYCTSAGKMYMLDGITGYVLDEANLSGNVEASPAAYEDWVVVGTRACKIWGLQLK